LEVQNEKHAETNTIVPFKGTFESRSLMKISCNRKLPLGRRRETGNRSLAWATYFVSLIIFCTGIRAEWVDGRAICWNCFPSTTNADLPAGLTDIVAIASGVSQNLALRKDGTVVSWGRNTNPPPALSNVVAIAAGNGQSLALKRGGTVVAWGSNFFGQTNVPAGLSNVVAIAAAAQSLALKADGTVVSWGPGAPGLRPAATNLIAIAAGGAGGLAFNLALRSDGRVIAWGINREGSTDVPRGLSNVIAVAAGEFHGLALKSEGTVVGWGYNYFGQATPPSDLSGVVSIAAAGYYSLALRRDGTVVSWGGQTNLPVVLSNVVAIAAGSCSLAITVDPKISSIEWANPNAVLRFRSFSGRQYSVQYSTDLGTGNWTSLLGLIEGDGRTVELIDTDAVVSSQRFYRVMELP